jgi:hypothetical protein
MWQDILPESWYPSVTSQKTIILTRSTVITLNLIDLYLHWYRILVGKPEAKRPLGRPRRRWVDNIKMDLREIGWDGMDWMDLAQDRDQWRALVNTVMNLLVP